MDSYTQIESYLMNVMSKDEKALFESRMSEDNQLKADVEAHVKMKVAMNELLAEDVRNVMANIDNASANIPQVKVISHNRNINRRRYFSIAASLLILVCAGWWITKPMSAQNVYSKYVKLPKDLNTRSNGTVTSDPITIKYYQAHQLLKDKKYSDAIIAFETLQIPNDHIFYENKSWFIALTNLMIDEKKAINQFKSLSKIPNHKYAQEINAVLKDLKIE